MQGKNILIIGFTKRTSFHFARVIGKSNTVIVSDSVKDKEKEKLLGELVKEGISVVNLLGEQSTGILDRFKIDIVVVSPGVPLNIPLIIEAKKRNIKVTGDIELFYNFFPGNFYIGITGTDGKTTTTTLIYEIVRKEKEAYIGGNIGIPIFKLFDEINEKSILVLELSSFQLEAIEKFKPYISVFLNLAEDHLDRYSSMKEYLLAKKRIFMNQTSKDFAVVNFDSPYYEEITEGIRPKILRFSRIDKKADAYFDGENIYISGKFFMKRKDIFIKGIHNVENSMAAILASKAAGISDESIIKTLIEFKGVEHRLEFVRKINGVEFYNDSKSTTVNSLEKALLSFEKPLILIAGGRDKGLDFTKLRDLAAKKLKYLILIGEAKEKMKRELAFEKTFEASSLEEAVKKSYQLAEPGDVVLLSPGCTSFDMFSNYEERGKVFKDCVSELI